MEERAWALYDYVKKEIVSDWYELSRRMANTERMFVSGDAQRLKRHVIDTSLFAYMLALKLRPKFKYTKRINPKNTLELMDRISKRKDIDIVLLRNTVMEIGEIIEKLGYTKVEKTMYDASEAVMDMG